MEPLVSYTLIQNECRAQMAAYPSTAVYCTPRRWLRGTLCLRAL